MKLFSILIANYNNGHFFKDCYKSILEQEYQNWEVVIVDDASTDNSIALIEEIIKGDNRFKLFLNNRNMGCGYTKKKCTDLASGDILGFLDPDDALYKDALSEMVNSHLSNPLYSLVTSKYDLVDLEMRYKSSGEHGSKIPSGHSYLTFGKGALTAFASFKKCYYSKTEKIDVNMKRAVDQDLYYKMEEVGKLGFIDKVLYKYRIHQGSISQNDNLYKAQYWHFYALNNAFKRRVKLKINVSNFSISQIKTIRVDYYINRLRRLKFKENTLGAKLYFLNQAFKASFFYRFNLKLKSLILIITGRI